MVYPAAVRVGNSPNQDPRRAKVSQVILHHTASTGDVNGIWNMFMSDNSRSVSANFLVAQSGDVLEVVNPDTGRAWTTGSGPGGTISPDHSAITMECMDATGEPTWLQSAASQEAIAQAVAWASERYGFPIVRGVTVRGHREMPGQNTTACPGGMPLDSITNRAIAIRGGAGTEEDDMTPAQAQSLADVQSDTVFLKGQVARIVAILSGEGATPNERQLVGNIDAITREVTGFEDPAYHETTPKVSLKALLQKVAGK